jgi:hypothetical protein
MYWVGLTIGLVLGFRNGMVFGPEIKQAIYRKRALKELIRERERDQGNV